MNAHGSIIVLDRAPCQRARDTRRMAGDIVRSPIKATERPRRGLEERLYLKTPGLARRGTKLIMRLGPRSRLRRAALIYGQRTGLEASNREDLEVGLLPFHPDYEFTFAGDALQVAPDLKQHYRGHAETLELLRTWREGFDKLRFEPRELLDPGGARFGVRIEQIGHASGGIEVRQEHWAVLWLRNGLVVRQQVFFAEQPALDALGEDGH